MCSILTSGYIAPASAKMRGISSVAWRPGERKKGWHTTAFAPWKSVELSQGTGSWRVYFVGENEMNGSEMSKISET